MIEVDGATHGDERKAADAKRTAFIEELGYKVIRVGNTEIFENLDGVWEDIASELGLFANPTSLPAPFPEGRGEQESDPSP